jgi:LCP family protein required for cell wall assembly
MKQNRRRPSNAIDGFVPRNRVQRAEGRASLDSEPKAPEASEGFVPRKADASHNIELSGDDSWVDENTLSLDEDTSLGNNLHSRRGAQKPPHFWQFAKKRRLRKGKPESSLRKKIVKRTILVIVLILVLIGGFLGWKVLRATSRVFNGNILGILNTTKLKGEDTGRVNILLAGNSADDKGHDGANLTDSIMVVSLNTKDNSAFMISIPRDLYVDYGTEDCSVGYKGKINAAYICGEQTKFSESGYPDGGMGLLEKVVHQNFGLDINYYALVNYGAFRDAVDAVGGVTINIQSSDPRGIYDSSLDYTSRTCCALAKYPNGPVTLNGKQALNLARARGDHAPTYGFADSDFTRTKHQRQMLVGLKEKALSAGTLSNPAKIGSLFDSLGGNVKTDFEVSEIRRLYDLGKKVQSNDIKSIGLSDDGVSLVQATMLGSAGSVVVPVTGTSNFTQIKAYILKLTSSDPVVREGATVAVLNASGVVGLAQKQSDLLTAKGLTVSGVGNATQRTGTAVVDLTGGKKNSTKSYLQKQFGVTATTDTVANPEAKNYKTDFVIIIGAQTSGSTSGTSTSN